MPRTIPIGSSAALAALAMPTNSWGQLMASRDQQLRYQSILTQQSEQELLQEQQADAQRQAYLARLKSLPLELPDKQRVGRWLKGKEAEVTKKLRDDYQGNLTQFMAAEGPSWMQSVNDELQNSDEYRTGLANLEAISQAKEAMRKGESLLGEVRKINGSDQYVSATEQMQDYYLGKTPRFTFKGSYKDDSDQMIKHFGSQYGPSKFERMQVPDAEIQNYLKSAYSPEVASDIYYNKFVRNGSKLFYKVDPLEDKLDFLYKQQDQAIQLENQGTKRQMDRLRFTGLQQANAIRQGKLNEMNREQQEAADPGAYMRKMIPRSLPQQGVEYNEAKEVAGNKVLTHSGYDLRNFIDQKTPGKKMARFNALDILSKQSSEAIGSLIGAEKTPITKENPTGWRGGKVLEGITTNGFNAIDLAGTNHTITHIDPKIYTNPREFDQRGQPYNPNGPMGFLKVRVRLADSADAKKAGLTEGLFSSDSRVGAGAYNSKTQEVELYTPIGDIYKNAALNRFLSVQDLGQKTANDLSGNDWTLGVDND